MSIQRSLSLKKYSISDRNCLDKKPQPSIRYANVKAKTDSGFNASKKFEIEKEISKYYNVRSDEVFKRISLGDLIHLMVAYAEECNLIGLPPSCVSDTKPAADNVQVLENNAVEVYELIHNSDEQKMEISPSDQQEINNSISCPFLLIDVRGENEFKESHLATALSHPHLRLSRSVGWECPEMREFKNHPEKIIVLYDENEMLSSDVASMLIHRGYSNIFVLSGGIKLARDKISYPFVTTECSKTLSSAVANFLWERSAFNTLPSHHLQDTVNWLQTKIANLSTHSNKMERENTANIQVENTQVKKVPWR